MSSSIVVSRHREKESFFGFDGRGRLFTSMFLQGSYHSRLNEGNPDSIIGTDAWEVMRCENYEHKRQDMSNDDVHNELVDFLTRTGLFHRLIDAPTGASAQVSNWTSQIHALVNAIPIPLPQANIAATIASINGIVNAAGAIGNQNGILNILNQLAQPGISQPAAMALRSALLETIGDALQGAPAAGKQFTTLASSKEAKQLWQSVYANWGNLQEETRRFYNAFMRPMHLNNYQKWVEMEEKDFAGPINDSNVRINLIRAATSPVAGARGNNPLLSSVIPFLPSKATGIWYSDASRTLHKIAPNAAARPNKFVLVDAYTNGYDNKDVAGQPISLDKLDPMDRFTIWVDKLVRMRLMHLKRSPTVSLPSADEKQFISLGDHNIWKHDGEGKLFKSVNGKVEYYGDTDQNSLSALKADFKCYSTLTKGNDKQCQEYMFDCLLSGDADGLKKCRNFHADANFYDVAKEDIQEMHPIVALRTLQKYGFRYISKYDDEAKMNLNKVEPVKHWLENYMAKKFPDPEDQRSVQGNTRLLDYLELIVQYVNANPTLINKHFSGSSEEGAGKFLGTDFSKRLQIKQRVEPGDSAAGLYGINLLQSHMRTGLFGATMYKSPFSVSSNTGLLRSPFGDAIFPLGAGLMVPRQLGGNGYYGGQLYSKRTKEGIVGGSETLSNLILLNMNKLREHNKDITEADKNKINKKLANMHEVEKELYRNLDYINSYGQLLDAMGDYNSQTLSIDSLRDLTLRHKDLMDKHNKEEKGMLTVLGAIQKLIVGRDAPEMTEIDELNYQPISLARA